MNDNPPQDERTGTAAVDVSAGEAALAAIRRARDSAVSRDRERALIEDLVEALPVMITLYRPETGELRVNREFTRITGWTDEDAARHDIMEACYPDPAYRAAIATFMQSLEPGWRDYRITTRDGRVIDSAWANIRLADGTHVGIGIDVRQQRWTERMLRFLSAASAAAASSLDPEKSLPLVAAIAVPDIADWCSIDLLEPDGSIRRVAHAHSDPDRKRLAAELLERNPLRLDADRGVGAVIRTGRPEFRAVVPESDVDDGPEATRLRTLGLRSVLRVPIEAHGQRFGALSLAQADSGRQFTEFDLACAEELAHHAAAAIHNARVHAEIRKAREAAEAASEAKSQFLAVISHELRTPLTAVIGFSDLLESEVLGPMNALQKDRLNRIKQSSWHLVSIIDEILTFTRAEAGKDRVHIGPVDLLHLTRNVATLLEPRARERNIALHVEPADGLLIVQSDEGKLRQILVNLVGNAVKFTEHGEVVIRTTTDDGHIEVHVRDTGPGIPAEHIEKIFEPFYQIDASNTRTNGGTGLGLAVCRTLAALLGGRIAVDSTPGVGSTFTLRLPIDPAATHGQAPPA